MRRTGRNTKARTLAVATLLLGTIGTASAHRAKAPVAVTVADTGKVISAAAGQPVAISLEAATDGGYTWALSLSDGVTQIGRVETRQLGGGTSGMVGTPALQTVTVKATARGKHEVFLAEGRPWEGGKPPLKTFEFTLYIR